MSTVVASHFLAGAVLSLALPIGAVIAVGFYWALLLRRRSSGCTGVRTSYLRPEDTTATTDADDT